MGDDCQVCGRYWPSSSVCSQACEERRSLRAQVAELTRERDAALAERDELKSKCSLSAWRKTRAYAEGRADERADVVEAFEAPLAEHFGVCRPPLLTLRAVIQRGEHVREKGKK